MGALCVVTVGQGAAERRPPSDLTTIKKIQKGQLMLRRNVFGILVLALVSTVAFGAQAVKEMPRTPVKPINSASIVDINTAPEADIVSIGIERSVAKKIVEGRPWRNKRDLVTRQLLSKDQYEKFKNSLVAKQPRKG
jgi:DNA uptake protein ComE-like DNA-binding protein